jgi:hypothetical protein
MFEPEPIDPQPTDTLAVDPGDVRKTVQRQPECNGMSDKPFQLFDSNGNRQPKFLPGNTTLSFTTVNMNYTF